MSASGFKPAPPQAPPPGGSGGRPLGPRLERFWGRVTDGMEVSELWAQFKADARTSYRLYSRELPARPEPSPGAHPGRADRGHAWAFARAFFWAVLLKLSPARRVLLLLALVLLVFPSVIQMGDSKFQMEGLHIYAG